MKKVKKVLQDCTLVVEMYQHLGLLPLDIPSNEYTPADFAGNLKLCKGKLSDIKPICKGVCNHEKRTCNKRKINENL